APSAHSTFAGVNSIVPDASCFAVMSAYSPVCDSIAGNAAGNGRASTGASSAASGPRNGPFEQAASTRTTTARTQGTAGPAQLLPVSFAAGGRFMTYVVMSSRSCCVSAAYGEIMLP